MLEALSREFRSGVPWEDLYADDLVIIDESLEECVRRLLTWKEAMEKKGQSKCRKDKVYDLRYGTGPPAEFRRVSMRRLLHWSGQQQHLLQWLQALGAQEIQWAQALEKKTLTTDVHGARELHVPWMADHRRKSRSDLTSLRW